MGTVWQDLRYGARMLARQPVFTCVAILALALGIGANTAIFSVINAVLLEPLPYNEPERLVMVWETLPGAGITQNTPAPVNFIAWRDENQVFEAVAAFKIQLSNLTGVGEPEQVRGQRVSASLLPLLGVEPALGRSFLPEEDQPGGNSVVIISDSLWRRRFGSDPDILGRTIVLGNVGYAVIGVLPGSFRFPISVPLYEPEFFTPLAFTPAEARDSSRNLWGVIARLKPAITYRQAQADIDTIIARLQERNQHAGLSFGANVVPLREQVSGRIRAPLLILLAAAGFVLLIACANVANLLLARAAARQKEIAIRTALGAGQWRLTRQFLTESLLLAGLGGVAGLFLALEGVRALVSLIPDNIARAEAIAADLRVLAFTLAVSIATGCICGLAPALQAFRPNLNEALKEGGRDSNAGGRSGVRGLLVIAEVAMALVLLVGAGLLLKSFYGLTRVDMGFQPEGLLTVNVSLPSARYSSAEKITAFYDEMLARIEALPGVESVGAISGLPVSFQGGGATFTVEGRQESTPLSNFRIISPDYFRTLRIPLVAGRHFNPGDRAGEEAVTIISESLARLAWPDEDPLGRRIRWGSAGGPWMTVVGVVKDIKLAQTARVKPHVYMPYSQVNIYPYEMAIRTRTDPLSLAPLVREEVWAIDKDLPVANVRTMEQVLSSSLSRQRFNMLLFALLGALALVLSAVGIYGVVSYTVQQNTREIGIRMALGAEQGDVLRLVLGHGLILSLAGVAIGLAASLALTRVLASLLYGVSATDLSTFIAIPLLLTGVALVACYIPARRAAKVDPMVALRYE